MAVQWQIDSMSVMPSFGGQQNVVVLVNWSCVCPDNGVLGIVSKSTAIELDSADPFIPYSDLTQNQVIEWVQTALGADTVSNVETDAQAINQEIRKAPMPISLPNPWE